MSEDKIPIPSPRLPGRIHRTIWGDRTPLVGMIHLLPLPGSPRFGGSMDEILTRASLEAVLLADAGFEGVLVENFGDAPFFPHGVPPETVAAMAVAVREVAACVSIPVGVNVLRNDAESALSVAVGAGARFIRVNIHTGSMFTDQGLLEGQAYRTLRKRTSLQSTVAILADVMVKHSTPPPGLTLESAARDVWSRGMADGVILTGAETGMPTEPEVIQRVREALSDEASIWVGSGASPETISGLLQRADGVIVGSALQVGGIAGAGIDPSRVSAFVRALERG